MNKLRKKHTLLFVLLDYLMSFLVWCLFYLYRRFFIEPGQAGYNGPFEASHNFYLGLLYVPAAWILLYWITGTYNDIWRKSRLKELSNTFTITLAGTMILFFALVLDDEVRSYKDYYSSLLTLFAMQYGALIIVRLSAETYIKSLILKQKIGFHTLIIGNNQLALDVYREISSERFPSGYIFKGFVSNGDGQGVLGSQLNYLGTYEELPKLISRYGIEEVIIAIESSRHSEIIKVTNLLEDQQVIQKIIPDTYDMLSGSVRLDNVVGTALIQVKHDVMPLWQRAVKRALDIGVSALVLTLLSPVYLAVAIAVKRSSQGPVFFKQIRIGRQGKPFHIYKFRSMYVNAEADGPALSSEDDKRITRAGKMIRKYRLDEIPQFYNVLVGEMSLVGPRPERKFFIDQIIRIAPHYKQLQRVRPGITSWGMVKYGYAENVQQMVERLKFDILYIENMSISVDFRIMIYTVKTILQGKGK